MRILTSLRLWVVAVAVAGPVGPAVAERPYDGYQDLLEHEAQVAIADGDLQRAWHYYWRLLQIDPDDPRALRGAGMVAHALGRYAYAERAFARVVELRGGAPDPEIHYLRGEALLQLGRDREAMRELDRAELEIGPNPADRQPCLWLARIAALRGDLDRAVDLYIAQLPDDRRAPEWEQVMLLIVEAHIFSDDWAGAERLLRQLLDAHPRHERAAAMLAWVLESQGKIDEELDVRHARTDTWGDYPRKLIEYGRARERAYDYGGALEMYSEARELGVREVEGDIARLELRTSPELAGGAIVRTDPSGTILGGFAGASVPVSRRLRLAVTGLRDTTSGGLIGRELSANVVSAWAVLTGRHGTTAALSVIGRDRTDELAGIGGVGIVRSSPARSWQVHVRAEAHTPWRESTSTIREGGVVDGVDLQVYATPWSGRLVLGATGRARLLSLEPRMDAPDTSARMLFGAVGADLVLLSNPERVARGQVLDDDLLFAAPFGEAIVVSYRHYELDSDDPFGERLVLVERSSLDEVSGVARTVLDEDGVFGVELRGGLGYDWVRSTRQWRAGGSLLVGATANSRLTVSYDIANESTTGLVGQRQFGTISLHVDL